MRNRQALRRAVCHFSDIGWRRHPDDRALGAFDQVLTAPFAGAGHRARALIATAVFHRYSGDEDFPFMATAHDLLAPEDEALARRIGLAARLGFALSASRGGRVAALPPENDARRGAAGGFRGRDAIAGEPVQKRLGALAALLGRKGEILIG